MSKQENIPCLVDGIGVAFLEDTSSAPVKNILALFSALTESVVSGFWTRDTGNRTAGPLGRGCERRERCDCVLVLAQNHVTVIFGMN